MSRAIIVVALLCLATFVLAAEENLGVQRCSATTICQDGFHCCSTTTCCPNSRYCCGGGRYCCTTSNTSKFGRVPAILSSNY
nr:uncharacterized protein LOC106682824 [Halyomorpha halys]